MKIRYLFTCVVVSIVAMLPLHAQVGKEMKAFRNKEGISVTLLTPSLYNLYKQGDLSLDAEETLKNMKEINVMLVDVKRATPEVVEDIHRRIAPIVENESKYTLVQSHQGAYGVEHLYVTQSEERITSLVMWSEEAGTLSIIELKGSIDLENVDDIAKALNVKGLERLAYINSPSSMDVSDEGSNPRDFIKRLEERFGIKRDSIFGDDPFGSLRERFGIKRDSIFGDDPFGSLRERFGSADDMMKRAEEMFRNMGSFFNGLPGMSGSSESISNGLEVIQENGKTRIKVNATNSEIAYLIDGVEYAPDSLKDGIPDEIANVMMVTSRENVKKSYVIINTKQKAGQFVSFSNGVLKYKYKNQEYIVAPEKLTEPSLLVNNRLTQRFDIDPMDIIQIRPATESERKILGAPSAQVVIVTNKMNFGF